MARVSIGRYDKVVNGEFSMADDKPETANTPTEKAPEKQPEPPPAPVPSVGGGEPPSTTPPSAEGADVPPPATAPESSGICPPPAPAVPTISVATVYPQVVLPAELVGAVRELEAKFKIPVRLWLQLPQWSDGPMPQPIDGPYSSIRPHLVDQMIGAETSPSNDKGVALIIHSPGGDSVSAYRLATFLQKRFGFFYAIVPEMAKSAATLLSLGARKIGLGPNAELGPLDMQVHEPAEREGRFSALDEVQALERLHDSAMTAALSSLMTLRGVTGKKYDVLLPMCLKFVADMWRPLFEKIDVVHWTKMARALKVGEDYASRLLRKNHDKVSANFLAEALVKNYPEHGFAINLHEAKNLVEISPDFTLGLKAEELPEVVLKPLKTILDSMRKNNINALFGSVIDVPITPPNKGDANAGK